MNIKDLIGETTEYDKKLQVELKRPKSWCKSVSAFANTFGGSLIFGISNENEIKGLEDPDRDAEMISEIIKNRLDPIPQFRIQFYRENGRVLLIVDVLKGSETPYYYSGDGVFEAYVRIGNESVKATATELKRLVLRGCNTTFDSRSTSFRIENFAFSKLRERYRKWTGNTFDEKELVSFGMATEDGYLTNAGALIADESPIRYSRVFCTRWNGLSKSGSRIDAHDDAEFSGGLIYLLENGEEFIRRNCRKMWRKTSNSREEYPEYVERSYHEALVNALVHRDYLINGSEVHIDIYDDRLEIYSPGGMPDGSVIQERDPLTVPSTRRNPVIADVFNRLGYMERKGSGFAKILDNYSFQMNYTEEKKPYFRSDRYQFTVIMPNLNYSDTVNGIVNETENESDTLNVAEIGNDTLNDTLNVVETGNDTLNDTLNVAETENDTLNLKIISYIQNDGHITISSLANLLNVSRPTIARAVKNLQKNGIIERIGSRKSGIWEIVGNLNKK